MNAAHRNSACRAFTLVELLAVLVVLALLAAVAANLALASRAAPRAGDVAKRVFELDRNMRQEALASGQELMLHVELAPGRLRMVEQEPERQVGRALELPAAVRIDAVKLAGQPVQYQGSAMVRCSARGWTTSYALRLRGPAEQSCWAVVLGLSAHHMILAVDDERELDQILNPPSSGNDAR
jgi:prepilin-type N-terminal cleavage/methylation domain-containing protein